RGQELIQYLAQLDGLEYAVVDRNGTVTGLLRQSAVLGALTGKSPGSGKRMFGQSR
ncbi:MAG: site-2 protease family protein, partial [Arthrobacter sp.]|nr:site-2 protease family protein [Arthrobacter sp.]